MLKITYKSLYRRYIISSFMDGFSIVMLIFGFVVGVFFQLFTGKSTSNHHCLGEYVFSIFASIELAHPRNASGCEEGKVRKYVEIARWL